MATEYYNISREEMDAFLTARGFKPILLPGTVELVYGKRVDQGNKKLTLRVYTSITPDGHARKVGADAIRVALFVLVDGKPVHVGGDKRVHRVLGWAKNLQARLDAWQEGLPDHDCPKCTAPLTLRDGKYGKFMGCASYPNCKYVEKI